MFTHELNKSNEVPTISPDEKSVNPEIEFKKLLENISQAKQLDAEAIAQANPELLLQTGTIVDHSGRIIQNVTPLQLAYGAGDYEMCVMLLKIAKASKNYDEILRQLLVFDRPDHESKPTIYNFTEIETVISANKVSNVKEIKEVKEAILKIKTALAPGVVKAGEIHFYIQHFIQACLIYNDHLKGINGKEKWSEEQCAAYWQQVIGFLELNFPACIAQVFCQGIFSFTSPHTELKRTLSLKDGFPFHPKLPGFSLYSNPLYSDASYSGLGLDCAISLSGQRCNKWNESIAIEEFQHYIDQKILKLTALLTRARQSSLNQIPNARTYANRRDFTIPESFYCSMLEYSSNPLTISHFVNEYNQLTPKGMALVLEYYYNKKVDAKKEEHKVCFALGVNTLIRTIELFDKSKEKDLTLLFSYADPSESGRMAYHRSVFRLEKYNSKIYIFSLDSLSSVGWLHDFLDQLNKKPELHTKIMLCRNSTRQQSTGMGCSHFALKNISKLLTISCLAKELEDKYHIKPSTIEKGIQIYTYPHLVECMYLAQSYDNLQEYIKENEKESSRTVRVNKANQPENLVQYAAHKREGFGIKSPKWAENKHYKDEKDAADKNIPKYIQKNSDTIFYFAEKHKKKIVPSLFAKLTSESTSDQNKLREAINRRNASLLEVDPETMMFYIPKYL